MANPMTHDEIKALLAGVTPGEWQYNQMGEFVYVGVKDREGPQICQLDLVFQTDKDGFFIAAAPALVRQLLEENEALGNTIDMLEEEIEAKEAKVRLQDVEYQRLVDHYAKENAELRQYSTGNHELARQATAKYAELQAQWDNPNDVHNRWLELKRDSA